MNKVQKQELPLTSYIKGHLMVYLDKSTMLPTFCVHSTDQMQEY